MKKTFLLFLPLAAFLLLFFVSCENDYPSSVYDASDTGNPTPVITSVSPASVSTAAVEEIL
jgi:hypothetical protein